jgi:hypothetical protein
MRQYRYVSDNEEFQDFLSRIDNVFVAGQELPDLVFNDDYNRFRMSDAPDGQREDDPWACLEQILKLSGTGCLWFGIKSPQVTIDWYREVNQCYPICQIFKTASADDYRDATYGPLGRNSSNANDNWINAYHYAEQLYWIADDYSFAMYAETYAETCIIAFHKDLKIPDELRQQWFFSVDEFTLDILYPGRDNEDGEFNRQLYKNYHTDDKQ